MTKKDILYIVILVVCVGVQWAFTDFVGNESDAQIRQLKEENKTLVDRVEALEVYAHVTDLKLEKRIENAEGNIKYLEDKDKYLDKE